MLRGNGTFPRCDVELRAGGTLAKYARKGAEVVYAVATASPHYHPWPEEIENESYLSNEEIIRLRNREARQGAEIIGVSSVHFFNYRCLYWYREGNV